MCIHSHFAVGLFLYLFKHAPVNYSSRRAPRAVHLYREYETSHPCFYLAAVKMYLRTQGRQKGDTSEQRCSASGSGENNVARGKTNAALAV